MDEGDLPRALDDAIQTRNFLRAVSLARRLNRSEAEIRDLQEKALRQCVLEFRNPHGAKVLVDEFKFTGEDLKRILQGILAESQEAEQKETAAARRRFDVESMDYLSLEAWIRRYFKV
jgi:hypothetical protein